MDITSLETGLDRAVARLQKLAASNAPIGSRIRAEIEYGEAYRKLVRAGVRPPLRRKYRIGNQ